MNKTAVAKRKESNNRQKDIILCRVCGERDYEKKKKAMGGKQHSDNCLTTSTKDLLLEDMYVATLHRGIVLFFPLYFVYPYFLEVFETTLF